MNYYSQTQQFNICHSELHGLWSWNM